MRKPNSVDIGINGLLKLDILQPKYDGWYVEGVCDNGKMVVYSTTGAVVETLPIPAISYMADNDSYSLRGEYLFGTNRAKNNRNTYMTLMVYDVIFDAPYHERYAFLQKWFRDYNAWCLELGVMPRIFLTPNYSTDTFPYFMEEIKVGRLEGLVGRMYDDGVHDAIRRYKPNFCMDFILLHMTEGQGRLVNMTGAFIGGQYKDGVLIEVCHVGGMSDAVRRHTWNNKGLYLGKVFEAEGNQVFEETGALRHPRFKRWRLDVLPQDVKWKDFRYAE